MHSIRSKGHSSPRDGETGLRFANANSRQGLQKAQREMYRKDMWRGERAILCRNRKPNQCMSGCSLPFPHSSNFAISERLLTICKSDQSLALQIGNQNKQSESIVETSGIKRRKEGMFFFFLNAYLSLRLWRLVLGYV